MQIVCIFLVTYGHESLNHPSDCKLMTDWITLEFHGFIGCH